MSNALNSVSRRNLLKTAGALAASSALGFGETAFAQDALAGRDLLKDKRPVVHPDGPKLGCYDPWGDFKDDTNVATEHLFLPWEDVELSGLAEADAYANERGRNILITIEPWSWDLDWNVNSSELRARILAGHYDENLRAICNAVKGFKSKVIIRWAQEMENPSGRFTWSMWNPKDYVAAYRNMFRITKDILPDATMMWSPKGLETLVPYYPGDEYVDLVGLSVFGYDEYDKIEFGGPRTFVESLQVGYDTAVDFGKPIWVAELGYEGNLDYLTNWVQDVTFNHAEFPELKEVVYFNDKEVWRWPHGLGLPDWRVIRGRKTGPATQRSR